MSKLLGEVPLEAAEYDERTEEEHDRYAEQDEELRAVPPDPVVGQDVDHVPMSVHDRAVGAVRVGAAVDRSLEGEHDRRDRIEPIEPGMTSELPGDLLVRVHDWRRPEPGLENDVQEVLGVA